MRKQKFFSLRRKFILTAWSLLFFAFLVYGTITLNNINQTIRKNVESSAINFVELSTKPLAENYDTYFDSGYYKYYDNLQKLLAHSTNISSFQIVNVDNEVIFDSKNATIEKYTGNQTTVDSKYRTAITSTSSTNFHTSDVTHELEAVVQPYITDWNAHPYSFIYYVDYSQVNKLTFNTIIEGIFLFVIFFIITFLLFNIFINRIILKPLEEITAIAQAIENGNLANTDQVTTNDEIGILSKSLRRVANQLVQNIKDLKEVDVLKDEFIDISARNLRSPVIHIDLDIKFMKEKLKHKLTDKQFAILEDVASSNNKLQLLSEDLLNITSLKKGQITKLMKTPVNLYKTISEVIDEFKYSAQEKHIKMILETDLVEAPIVADENKIHQCLASLVSNAIKFNEQNGLVTIKFDETKSHYHVAVTDTGRGLSQVEIDHLFKPFQQSIKEGETKEGSGLSLYLAKLIMEGHNGTISVNSQINKGTTFDLEIPKK